MLWQVTVLSTPVLLALVVSLLLLGYVATVYRDHREDPVVVLYFWITVAAIVWTGFSALKLLHTDPAAKLLFLRLLHVGAAALPPLIFLFVLAFTDRDRWLRYEFVGAVFLVPGLFALLLFPNPGGLVFDAFRFVESGLVVLRTVPGPGFFVFLSYSTLLVVATLVVVALEIRRVGAAYYPQALLIAVAVLTPIAFAVLTNAAVRPFVDDRINLVPTAAAVSSTSFGVLLYRYRLVDRPPLAHATAMKYSPDALFVLDQQGQVISTNDHGGDLLKRLDGSPGDPLSDAVPGFDPGSMSGELIETAAGTGQLAYHRVFVEPLTRGGRRVGWVVVLRDETEQQRQQQQLQQKNEHMGFFASTISHDLRNPLGVARGYLELAQEEVDSEELDRVESAHARMEEIINGLLTLARAGERIDTLETVPVDTVVERAWENVATDAAELSGGVDRTVAADPTMLQHVFENLFRNAVEHGATTLPLRVQEDAGGQSASGPSVADASADAVEHGDGDVTITVGTLKEGIYVEDDGDGIPPDRRAAMFGGDSASTTADTGFGLSIIERIVEAHGWEIRATESTDGGARFEISGIGFVE